MEYPNLNTSKLAELVEFYNAHADEPVKKFKDKATAVAMVQALIAKLEGTSSEELEEEVEEVAAENASSLLSQLTAINSGEKKTSTKNEGVWANVKILFDKGLSNKEALAALHEMYGNTNTTYACVAWYRNKYNKSSDKHQAEKQAKIDQVMAFADKHGLTDEAIADLAEMFGVVLPKAEEVVEAKEEAEVDAE